MDINIKAILKEFRNISFDKVIFEAITNSIQANATSIKIELFSDSLNIDKKEKYISSFSVIDNGDGFLDANLQSFKEYKSDLKIELGSKGIGRFLYLKLFHNIEIISLDKSMIFSEQGLKIESVSYNQENTKIFFKNPYSKIFIKLDKLYNQIKEHFLPYFKLLEKEINITIILDDVEKNISSLDIPSFKTKKFQIKNYDFIIDYSFETDKFLGYYCAGNRVVIENKNLNYEKKLLGFDSEKLTFLLYSKYFDETVNDERDDFNIYPKEKKQKKLFFDLSWQIIHINLQKVIIDILLDNGINIQDKKQKEIELSFKEAPFLANYIKSEELYLSSKEIIKNAKNRLNKDKDFLRNPKNIENNDFNHKLNIVTQSELAEYIFDREKIINRLELLTSNRQALEKEIHNLFMKQRTKDSNSNYKSNNLWLFDDRFMSYDKVFSEIHLKGIFPELLKNMRRPDILSIISNTYDKEKITDIVIIELKRADEKISPSEARTELLRYSRYVGESDLQNKVRIWSYAFLKFDEETELELEDDNYNKIITNNKYPIYYKYYQNRNTIINFLDYNSLVSDAKARNKIFIDILKGSNI